MKRERLMSLRDTDDKTLLRHAARLSEELEWRGLPDLSFKQGYKAGFLAALQDDQFGPGQVWSKKEVKKLHKELERRFTA